MFYSMFIKFWIFVYFYSKEFYSFASQILLFPMLINISSERSSGAYVPTLPFRMGDSHFEKRAPVFPALS